MCVDSKIVFELAILHMLNSRWCSLCAGVRLQLWYTLSCLLLFFLLVPNAMAMGYCMEQVSIADAAGNADSRFSTVRQAKHTDWVKVRLIVGRDGAITDPKPIAFSRDLYTNRVSSRVKRMRFVNTGDACYVDLVLWQVLNR